GSHPSHNREEIRRLVGKEIGARISLVEHDSKNTEDLVFLGTTKFGTPVSLNRRILETDVLLVAGTVVHHYFAGYGGGPKMINPGCAGYETITRNHALTIDQKTGTIHSKCQIGVLEGNPVQEDILDSMRFVKADFSLTTILDPGGDIARAMCGELFATHEQARKCIDEHYKVAIAERADVVVVSCGGFPKDINLIQIHKSIHNAFQAVKQGGVLLVLAECAQGVGSETFLDWFEYDDQSLKAALVSRFTLNATTALSLKSKAKAVKIILVSRLPENLVRKLGLTPAKTLDDGWREARKMLPENSTAFVIPNGSLTLPVLTEK
ncbi:MAG: nickel-dependent lactate racemase, partial [bacterium]